MNGELKKLIREVLVKGELNKNLVLLTYEIDSDLLVEQFERVSLVYEVKGIEKESKPK